MTTTNREQQPSASRRRPPQPLFDACRTLGARRLKKVWAAYLADRSDWRLRNRLVEHYAPWVRETAGSIAHKLGLRDEENAVGEVLMALVETIVPDYDGQRDFERWARVCIKRELIDQQRGERNEDAVFTRGPFRHGRGFIPEFVHDRQQPNFDLNFVELTAELSDLQAMVIWLMHYRGMEVRAIAELLNVTRRSVGRWRGRQRLR